MTYFLPCVHMINCRFYFYLSSASSFISQVLLNPFWVEKKVSHTVISSFITTPTTSYFHVLILSYLYCLTQKQEKKEETLNEKNEEVSGWKTHVNTRMLKWKVSTIDDVYLDQKRVHALPIQTFTFTSPLLHKELIPSPITLNSHKSMPDWCHLHPFLS